MKPFFAFFKKELLETIRSGRLWLLGCLFLLFGVMNPAIAKLTPWLMEILSDSMAESGMTVTAVIVDATTSWVQFFKNIPMALIVVLLLFSGSFTKEYEQGTLILILTKGLPRYNVVMAKALTMLLIWTGGYLLCFGVTYGYNDYFWDNSIVHSLSSAIAFWWLFGAWTICLTVLFSVIAKAHSTVLLGVGGCVLACYLLQQLPKLRRYMPTSLLNSGALIMGTEEPAQYLWAVLIVLLSSVFSLIASIFLMNQKEL